ncbi:hypothetical protein AB0C59_13125 [Streptomyces sp. NPDC048664]|uniref:hypothetical protein n=1 Tax=Streptomyces sp. NPDC048664 TaxID=3154505 RepID=UPI0034364CBF
MRTYIRLRRDAQDIVARVTPYQADVLHRVLTLLAGRDTAHTALAVRVGADREAVSGLAARFAGAHDRSFDMPLTVAELHVLHSALTAAPLLCVEKPDRLFSAQRFHELTGSYREHCDELALSLAREAASL